MGGEVKIRSPNQGHYHYQPTHLSHHLPLPPPTMMTGANRVSVVGGGGGGRDCSLWLQWVAVVGGAGEKFSKNFYDQKELKSPKKQHVFLLLFSINGRWVGGSDP